MVKASESSRKYVYPAGSFHGWQDGFIREVFPNWEVLDPRENRQGAIAKLVEDDMSGVRKADAVFCRLPGGKSLPTMGYAEIGSARVLGKPVILADENETRELVIHNLASVVFSDYQQGIDYLLRGDFELTQKEVFERSATNSVKKIAFAGDFYMSSKDLNGKELVYPDLLHLDNLAEADLLAVSFDRGKRDKDAIVFMGVAYTIGVPVILHEPNLIVYPPLAGLARRIFTGEQGREIMKEYISTLESNDINQESAVMYKLFKKFNS